MSLNILLISEEMLKTRTGVHTNIDAKLLRPEIKAAQDMYIHPILGSGLYNMIVSQIQASGSPQGDYKILLDDYIVDTLLYYILSELPSTLSFQFWNKGVVRKAGEDLEAPDMSDLIQISQTYRKRAEWYGERLVRYLREESGNGKFPEYTDNNDRSDMLSPERSAFTLPMNIDFDFGCESLDKNNCR